MPETHYARNGDVDIAYQVIGDGPIDLVFIEGFATHLDIGWEGPAYRRFCEQLAGFSRLIRFDKRGMGLSDRTRIGTLEERMDDARAVMDAVGSERAVFLGQSEGGPMSMLFAATYPERTQALVLCGAEICERKDEDWPWGESTAEEFETAIRTLPEWWRNAGSFADRLVPDLSNDLIREHVARLLRGSMSPRGVEAFMRMAFDIDVRPIVPAIQVPTLVLHRTDDMVCHVESARYLAAHLPGARYVELPGNSHVPWSGDDMLDEIREFLTGVREPEEPDRVLATVLFTDIVGSTDLATRLGDRAWRELLARHDQAFREQLARFRGREIKTTGDGFLAAFDGPARAIRCARRILDRERSLGLALRAGLHTGECERVGDDLAGIAVHIGARVSAKAGAGEVLVSSTVRDLVAGAGFEFDDRGVHPLKGVDGNWRLFAVR